MAKSKSTAKKAKTAPAAKPAPAPKCRDPRHGPLVVHAGTWFCPRCKHRENIHG